MKKLKEWLTFLSLFFTLAYGEYCPGQSPNNLINASIVDGRIPIRHKKWIKIYRIDRGLALNPQTNSYINMIRKNDGFPRAPIFSRIFEVEKYRHKGTFEFKLEYPIKSSVTPRRLIWRQSSNPFDPVGSFTDVRDFEPIEDTLYSNLGVNFRGLISGLRGGRRATLAHGIGGIIYNNVGASIQRPSPERYATSLELYVYHPEYTESQCIGYNTGEPCLFPFFTTNKKYETCASEANNEPPSCYIDKKTKDSCRPGCSEGRGKSYSPLEQFEFSHGDKCFYRIRSLLTGDPNVTCASVDAHLPRMKSKAQTDAVLSFQSLPRIALDLEKSSDECDDPLNCTLKWKDRESFINYANLQILIDVKDEDKKCFFLYISTHTLINEDCEAGPTNILCQRDCLEESFQPFKEDNDPNWRLIFYQSTSKVFSSDMEVLKNGEEGSKDDPFSMLLKFESFKLYNGYRLRLLYPESKKYIEWYQESSILAFDREINGYGLIGTNIKESIYFNGIRRKKGPCLFSQFSRFNSDIWFEFGCKDQKTELLGPHEPAKHVQLFIYFPEDYTNPQPYGLTTYPLPIRYTGVMLNRFGSLFYQWVNRGSFSFLRQNGFNSKIYGVMIRILTVTVPVDLLTIRVGFDPDPASSVNALCLNATNPSFTILSWFHCTGVPAEGKYIHIFKVGGDLSVLELFPYDYNASTLIQDVVSEDRNITKESITQLMSQGTQMTLSEETNITFILDDIYEVLGVELLGMEGTKTEVFVDSLLGYMHGNFSERSPCTTVKRTEGGIVMTCPEQTIGRVISLRMSLVKQKLKSIAFYISRDFENPNVLLQANHSILFNGKLDNTGVDLAKDFKIPLRQSWGPVTHVLISLTSPEPVNLWINTDNICVSEDTNGTSSKILLLTCNNPVIGDGILFDAPLSGVQEIEIFFGDESDITRGRFSFRGATYENGAWRSKDPVPFIGIDTHSSASRPRKVVLHQRDKRTDINVRVVPTIGRPKSCFKESDNVFFCDHNLRAQSLRIEGTNALTKKDDVFILGVEVHLSSPVLAVPLMRDCWGLWSKNYRQNYKFSISPRGTTSKNTYGIIDAQCNGFGWTQILYRSSKIAKKDDAFAGASKLSFINGFGPRSAEHWLGLDNVRELSMFHKTLRLQVVIVDELNTRHEITYDQFSIGPPPDYSLSIDGYSSRTQTPDSLSAHDGRPFFHGEKAGWMGKEGEDEDTVNFFGIHRLGPKYVNEDLTPSLRWKTVPNGIQRLRLMIRPKDDPPEDTGVSEDTDSKFSPPVMTTYTSRCYVGSKESKLTQKTATNVCEAMNCSISYCFNPPVPPKSSYLRFVRNVWSVRIGTNVTYVCPPDMSLNYTESVFNVQCGENGEFTGPIDFPNCTLKECPKLISNPHGGKVLSVEFRLSYRDACLSLQDTIKYSSHRLKWMDTIFSSPKKGSESTYELKVIGSSTYYVELGFNYPVKSLKFEAKD